MLSAQTAPQLREQALATNVAYFWGARIQPNFPAEPAPQTSGMRLPSIRKDFVGAQANRERVAKG